MHAASRLNDDQSGPTLVNLLLQAGADHNIESNEEKTPLHFAADSNYRYLTINLLLEEKLILTYLTINEKPHYKLLLIIITATF